MLLSHIINIGDRCCFKWEARAVDEIFHFGKWIFISSILGFLLIQGDRLLLGGLVSPEVLGVYTVAFFLANSLRDLILRLLKAVFLPLLSEVLRNSPNTVEAVYYKIRLRVDTITMPVAGFLFSTGGEVINLLYDERYENAGWMLGVLSLSMISIGFMLSEELFVSYGKPKFNSMIKFTLMVSTYVFVPVSFYYFGLNGAIWAIALIPLLMIPISMVVMSKYFFMNLYRELVFLLLVPIGYIIGEQLKSLVQL